MKSALLVRFGGLGDLLITLPSIRFLRARFPEARLTLISHRRYGELFLRAGIVDEIMPEDDRRLLPLFEAGGSPCPDFSARLESFDTIVAWTQGNPGDFLRKMPGLQAHGTRPCVIQANPEKQEPLSRVFFHKTASSLGKTASLSIAEWSRLPPTERAKDAPLKVVIHPGSGSEAKRWPLENFLKIVEELGERGIAGALVTGEAEEEISPLIEGTVLPPGWAWVRCPSLPALADLLRSAEFYLGNDSGVTHLAAACGTDVLALFRSEYASAWRPLGRVQVLSAASLAGISLESVRKKIFLRTRL